MSDAVATERDGRVLRVTLNRPEARNAVSPEMHWRLHEVWDAYAADPELWVAVLTGAGDRAFCAGNDLKAVRAGRGHDLPPSGFGGLCARFDRVKPIVAAVNGFAMGGGMEIALACDVILAADTAAFGLPEVRVGLFANAGGVQRLTRQIGRKAAVEMLLTGRHVGAEEARALGIVNAVVPAADLMAAAMAKAREIEAASPCAVRTTLGVLNALDGVERLAEALALSGPASAALKATEDAAEGVAAFAEKRAPVWRNR